MEIKNALIESTMLGREDHGILTFLLFIEFDGACTGVGGYALDRCSSDHTTRVFYAESMEIISRILDVVGVDKWEDLPGKYIRVKCDGRNKPIHEIGNIMKDRWLNIREFFAERSWC